jgi:putative lipoic acid-binding regulatory protein
MTENDKPLLEFPCDYTIKVLGRDVPGFVELVSGIVLRYAPDAGAADSRPSSKGSFLAINVTFTALSLEQLESMHRDLNACDQVTLIL